MAQAPLLQQRGFFFFAGAVTPLSQLTLTAPLEGSLPLRGGAAAGGGEVAAALP